MKKLTLFSLVLFAALSVFSAEYYVDASQSDDTGSATNWATAKKTIQAAVDLTTDGDIVWATNGTYNLSSAVLVTNAITIQSVNGSSETIVSGNASNSCFVLSNACVISQLTIKNGKAAQGGGVCCISPDPVVSHCVIADNSADYGGGMCAGTAFNCEFFGNSAVEEGGGLYHTDVNNSLIYSNYADIYAPAVSRGDVVNCTITENICGNKGGLMSQLGIVLYYCDVKNSIMFNNVGGNSCGNSSTQFSYFEDPGFTLNYYLSTSSPCRAAGSIDYASGVDLAGSEWLTPPSMGCYEVHAPFFMDLVGPTNMCVGTTGSYEVVIMGAVEALAVSFGDGQVITNDLQFEKAWSMPGNYEVVISGDNTDYPEGFSFTQKVQVVSLNDAVVYVSVETGDDNADGGGWANAKASIQAGVNAAPNGGLVLVSNGVYALNGSIALSRSIDVIAGDDPTKTIVDAGGNGRGFTLTGEGSMIAGMTITNGVVYNYPLWGTYGGGVLCGGGNHIITNCIIVGNWTGDSGGGVRGGTLYDSIVYGNWADIGPGGGISLSKAYRCIVQGNVARYGDGGGMAGGHAENCLITDNFSGVYGGGKSGGSAANCTILKNSAYSGGGMYAVTARNSIICDNAVSRLGINQHQSTLYNSFCGNSGDITNKPGFMDPEAEDYRLSASSDCINAGHNSYVSTTNDLDGNLRIIGGVVDMGAYERQDAGTDFDTDGLADLWEMENFGSRYSADPAMTCSNGVNNFRDAYIAGLDPKDPNSRFAAVMGLDQVLRWSAISGRVYSVWCSTNLLDGFQCLETNIPWTAGCFADAVHHAEGSLFYKIDVKIDNDAPGFSNALIYKENAVENVEYSASIVADANDPENDSMIFSKVLGPAWLSVASDGTLLGTPDANNVGLNVFTVQVAAVGGSDTAILNIIVDAAPVWAELTNDDFENGWGSWVDGGSDARLASGFSVGSQCFAIQDNSESSKVELSSSLDLTGYSDLVIDFSYVVQSFEDAEEFWVRYSSDDGLSWITIQTFVNDVDFIDDGMRYFPSISIASSDYTFSSNVKIMFECNASGDGDDVYIDNVVISAQLDGGGAAGGGDPDIFDPDSDGDIDDDDTPSTRV